LIRYPTSIPISDEDKRYRICLSGIVDDNETVEDYVGNPDKGFINVLNH